MSAALTAETIKISKRKCEEGAKILFHDFPSKAFSVYLEGIAGLFEGFDGLLGGIIGLFGGTRDTFARNAGRWKPAQKRRPTRPKETQEKHNDVSLRTSGFFLQHQLQERKHTEPHVSEESVITITPV